MKIAESAWGQAKKEKAQEAARNNAAMLRRMHEAPYVKPDQVIDLMLATAKVECEQSCSICRRAQCRWE